MKISENVKNTYDHYYRYEEISDLLKDYANRYPAYMKLEVMGESHEGRSLLLAKITDTSYGDFEDKPAFYAEGNIHAGEVTGSMVLMYFLDVIFTNLEDPEIKKILKDYTLYIVPRISPDGAEYYLSTPNSVRSVNQLYPFDEEEIKGIIKEDIDGDGVIRLMRVKSPYGCWKVSDKDERVMAKRLPDDVEGDFYNLYPEGSVKEYDGIHLEEAPNKYGFDFNRNYSVEWKEEGVQRGSGLYPMCHKETKANADFLLSHANVCYVLDYHTSGGMFAYPPGYKASSKANEQDMNIYKKLGEIAKEETGYPVMNVYDEFGNGEEDVTYGGFDDFCHFHVGVPAYTVELWDMPRRAGCSEHYPPIKESDAVQEENMVKAYKWIDENLDGEGYKPWTKFNHEALGEVEIGGIDVKYVVQNPPVKFLPQELEKMSRYMLRVIKALPRVSFHKLTSTKVSEGVYKIEVSVMNSGYLSTYSLHESLNKTFVKDLSLTLSGAEIVEGKELTKIGKLEGYGSVTAMNHVYGSFNYGDHKCETKVSWIIKGKEGDLLTIELKGGRIGKKTVTMKL